MERDSETLAWLWFAVSVFVLMGATLAGDAELHAESAASLPGGGGRKAALALAYRLAGAAFLAAAAALPFLARSPVSLDRPGRLAAGLGLGAIGFGIAARKLVAGPGRLPAGLEADDLAPAPLRPFGQRLASAARWLLVADFCAFACYLLSR